MIDLLVFEKIYILRNSENGKEKEFKKELYELQEVVEIQEFVEAMIKDEIV